jgi:hypothetical protein
MPQLEAWVKELRGVIGEETIFEVALTKCDLAGRQTAQDKLHAFAAELGTKVTETSAKTRAGVDGLFERIAHRLLEQANRSEHESTAGGARGNEGTCAREGANDREVVAGRTAVRLGAAGAGDGRRRCAC